MLKLAILIVLVGCISCSSDIDRNPEDSAVCFTTGCVQIGGRIRAWMNTSVDPCDDFYQYACGGFLTDTCLPESASKVDPFSIVNEQIQRQLLKLLVQSESANRNNKAFNITKTIFDLCVSANNTTKDGQEEVVSYFKQTNETWNDWIEMIIWLRDKGLPFKIFFDISVIRDKRNTSKTILKLDRPKVSNIEEWHLQEIFKNLTFSKKALSDHLKLSNRLQQKSGNRTTAFTTLKKFQLKFNYVQWNDIFNNLTHRKLSKNNEIFVADLQYFAELRKILKLTDKNVISNYLLVKTLEYIQIYNTRNFTTHTSRERWCLNKVRNFPGLGAMYVRTYFPKIPKDAFRIISNVKRQLKKIIKKCDWLDSSSKIYALEKLGSMHIQIGFPDDFMNTTKLDSYYGSLNLDGATEFLRSVRLFNVFRTNKNFRLLNQRQNTPRYSEVTIPNVSYDVDRNVASIPVAIMQGEFFSQQRPNFVNYASFGHLVGHAIASAFSLDGYLRDRQGNSIDWWEDDTKEIYINKTECILKQMTASGGGKSDLKGLSSNIADLISVKIALGAYRDWAVRHSDEKELPFVKENGNQLFWIAMAQNHCVKYRDLTVTTSRSRVNGVLSNFQAFASDFKCSSRSTMVPTHRCDMF